MQERAIVPAAVENCMACATPAMDREKNIKKRVGNPGVGKQTVQTVRRRRVQAAFLALYSDLGSMGAVCRQLRVGLSTIKSWMENDPIFRDKVLDAQASYQGRLERELVHRAVEGELHPVVSAGRLVTFERKKSDDLLKVALKAVDPEKYTEKGRQIGAKMGIDKEGNKFFKVYEGFDPDSV